MKLARCFNDTKNKKNVTTTLNKLVAFRQKGGKEIPI